jgi:hypothetical protein
LIGCGPIQKVPKTELSNSNLHVGSTALASPSTVTPTKLDISQEIGTKTVQSPPFDIGTILKELEARGNTLFSFEADVNYDVRHEDEDSTDAYQGHITYDHRKGWPEFSLFIDCHFSDGKRDNSYRVEAICDGRWLVKRDLVKKSFEKIELISPDSPVPPAAIGNVELPIGQAAGHMEQRWQVSALQRVDTDPVETQHLRLGGRKGDYTADLYIDRVSQIPVKVVVTQTNHSVTTINFTHLKINESTPEVLLPNTPATGSGWEVEIEPWQGTAK